MRAPGFTAETSLSTARVRHQGTPRAPGRGDILQPASSEVILLNCWVELVCP